MEKAKINTIQLFSMMFIFEMGTALVISYGITAGKDAWLAILLSTVGGLFLFFIYYLLFRQYPGLPLTGLLRKILGNYLGWMIGFLYVLYFLYLASRNVRDVSDLLSASTLENTPLIAISIPLVLAICYVLYMGIEVLARTSEVFIVILIFFGAAGNFFVLVSGNVEFHNLLPFLENGWKPILTTVFPNGIIFPFGEMVAFTMLLPLLNKPKYVKKVWPSVLISSGIVLSWTICLNIAVLGSGVTKRATFPTLATVAKVNLLDFIQRLDAIVVFTLLITVFFKVAIFLYVAVIGITDLFKLKSYHRILLPIATIVIFVSLNMASNFTEHLKEGDQMIYPMHMPMIVIIPLILLLVSFIRSKFGKKSN